MPIRIDIRRFQESITAELQHTQSRVRSLIGNANWGEDGRYKEAILRKLIKQYLPTNLEIGTGFIVSNDDYNYGRNGLISKQLDLIIYDGSFPVVFREGDFVVLTESSVRGVIEVKSKIVNYSTSRSQSNALNNILAKFNELNQFHVLRQKAAQYQIFTGIFSFEYEDDFSNPAGYFKESLKESNGLVNHISLGAECFIRYWRESEYRRSNTISPAHPGRCYSLYKLTSLSFSYFISNLIHITANTEPADRYWFSFPIEGSKESHGTEIIDLE
jgi:hypothetical protein